MQSKHHHVTASLTPESDQPFAVQCSDATAEREKVESLYKALTDAKKKAGEKVSGNLDSFAAFVAKKTSEIRKDNAATPSSIPSRRRMDR